jgi:formylmethanofuran dehydrogenase subunit C
MKLSSFMDSAYQKKGSVSGRRLKTRQSDMIFSLEDLADRIGERPSRAAVEELVSEDKNQLDLLISADPGKKYNHLWGYLSSLAAERSTAPLMLPSRDYVGLELSCGTIILAEGKAHVGERMKGGRIVVQGLAGDYLGQEMQGGGIIAAGCRDYAFRNMRGGFGLVRGDAGKFAGLGNSGGRIVVQGSCKERTGWLMRSGSLYVRGDAGEYLGLLMSGGRIRVKGKAGKRAGWRKKGGSIAAGGFGPEAADDVLGLD